MHFMYLLRYVGVMPFNIQMVATRSELEMLQKKTALPSIREEIIFEKQPF